MAFLVMFEGGSNHERNVMMCLYSTLGVPRGALLPLESCRAGAGLTTMQGSAVVSRSTVKRIYDIKLKNL